MRVGIYDVSLVLGISDIRDGFVVLDLRVGVIVGDIVGQYVIISLEVASLLDMEGSCVGCNVVGSSVFSVGPTEG